MPGNEVGDRVHNFFEQGNLSQDQRHTQLVEGSWPVFNNNLWGGSERQIGGHLNSSSKNYSAQQSDIERGQGNQFSLGLHGLNFTQSNLRPEFVKSPSQLQQVNLNGFMHTSQAVHTRQDEANFLGVDTEPDRHNLTSRGLSNPEPQQRSGSQHSNSASFGGSGTPMNFNFLGGQQQISGQQPGIMQSYPRQQSAINDAQLMQKHVMLKQMQEIQRQQQLQQLEAMQRSSVGQMSTFQNQTAGQHTPAINGNPLHEASNYPWSSQVMAGNTNWLQRGPSSSVQGYSNGLVITPEQGQALRFMGLVPQQASQSLYGVPVSNSRNANPFPQNNTDRPGMVQVPAPNSSFCDNQYAPLQEQIGMQGPSAASRSGSEGKISFEHATSQGLGNVVNLGSFEQRNVPISESARQHFAGVSESLHEKSVTQSATSQATSSQGAVALDPTEEKILFGNDDNIWEAFGGSSLSGTGGYNRPDGTDMFNGFPSVQSGTWSALMQSAVAETSSSDVGMQEEWTGVGSQSSRSQSGNQQPSAYRDNEKLQPVWVDSSQRASMGSRTTTNMSSNNAVLHTNYSASGLQQSYPNQTRESLQTGSQVPQEGRKWPDRNQPKPNAEERVLENANSSADCLKANTGFWSHQQNTLLHDNSGHPSNRPSALNFIESTHANGGIASSNQDNFNKDRNRHMSLGTGHNAAVMVSPHVNSKNDAGVPSVNNMKVNRESSEKLPENDHLDLWKPVNSLKSGTEGSVRDQHNLSKGPPILESSVNIPDGGASEMHEKENGDGREDSNDSHRSTFSHHAPAGGLRESVWSDVGDPRSWPGGKEKLSGQASKRAPVARKFQYHPMGDLDMDIESSQAAKQVLHSQPMSQHFTSGPKGHEAQPRFLGPSSTSSTDMEKGRVSSFHGAVKISHGVSSSGVHPGYLPNSSAQFVTSGEISSPNQHVSSSQNMLELLHKVDQSREQNVVSHLSPADCNSLSDTASGGHVGHNQGRSSTAHGFSLQLAPPSQGIPPPNVNVASHSSVRTVDSPSSGHVTSDKADKGHPWLASVSSAQCLPSSHPPPQKDLVNDKSGSLDNMDADGSLQNLKRNPAMPLASGSSNLSNQLQNQHITAAGGRMITDQPATLSFDRHAHHDQQGSDSRDQAITTQSLSNLHNNLASGRGMNQSGVRVSMRHNPFSPPAVMPGMPAPLGANLWNSQRQLLGAQTRNVSDLMKSQDQPNDTLGTFAFTKQKDEQDCPRRVDVGGEEPLAAEARSTGKTIASQEEEPSVRHSSDASPSNSAASQKDFEASHHSFKASNFPHPNYSLLHQMQAMKSAAMDPSHREAKRFKGPDNGPDTQQGAGIAAQPFSGGVNSMLGDRSVNCTSASSGDAKMLNFSPLSANRNTSLRFPQGTASSHDMLSFNRGDPQKLTAANVAARVEHAGISPQMAPSWFEQYGTFKNGQLLPVHNMPRMPMTKNVEQQFVGGKSPGNLAVQNSVELANVVADAGQIPNTCQTASASTLSEHAPSQHALVPHVSTPSVAFMRPKKRKTATSDLLPWCKEIGQGIKRLQNMSSAEIDWAKSSNRLVEKVEDEGDNNEDLLPAIRPKRRLIMTTQLIQQVFRPPSAAVLSLDARSNYEIIVYSLARLALGDASSLVCCMERDSSVVLENGDQLHGKVKTSEKIRDQYFSKVVEDFISRAKGLENDLLRLDKRASILDIRLECQDLERFSVINRFARFHGRGQGDGGETASSSDAGAATLVQRPFPQRYVSAHPMPRTVPERVQCLSL